MQPIRYMPPLSEKPKAVDVSIQFQQEEDFYDLPSPAKPILVDAAIQQEFDPNFN